LHFDDKNIKKVSKLVQSNKLDEALFYLEDFIKKDIVDPNIYNIKGAILSRKGRKDEAIQSLNKSLSINKEFIPAYKNLIQIYIETKAFEQVIENYENLINYEKNNPKNYNDLAIYYDLTGKKVKAVESIKKAIKLDNNSDQYHYNLATIIFSADNKSTYKEARDSFKNCLKINKKHALANYGIGMVLLNEKKYDEAKKYLIEASLNKEKFHNAYYNLGNCLIALGEHESALKAYKDCISANPLYAPGYNSIGNTYMQIEKPKKAQEFYHKQIELIDTLDDSFLKAQAYYNFGLSYHKTKDLTEAEKNYKKSLEYRPRFADAQSQLAAINLSNELNEDKKMDDDFLPIEELVDHTLDEGSIIEKIKKMINSKEYHKAEKECLKMIKLDELNAKYHAILSYALYGQHKIDEALDSIDKSISLEPKILKNYSHKGMMLYKKNKFNEAIEVLEHSLKINNNNAKVLTQIGLSYKRLGKKDLAEQYFKKALTVDPKYKNAQSAISGLINRSLDNRKKSIEESHKSLTLFSEADALEKDVIKISRLKHDVEQAEFLIQNNFEAEPIIDFASKGRYILNKTENENNTISLKNQDIKKEFMNYWSLPIIYNTKEISDYLNPATNWNDIQNQYLSSNPEFVVIDGMLSNECLIELRKFCLYSKVFLREYENNYLGAFGNTGFISNIHLGIAKDLKNKLPKIFGEYDLTHMWAFKYDSKLGSGINVHADFAKVNLNFWITPDDYNLNPNSGGLKVYTTPPPSNWTFEKYNSDQEEIYKYLKSENAGHKSAHYRFNRAVLFNSSLFHETEEIDFKNEYVGRRINVTYLFGHK